MHPRTTTQRVRPLAAMSSSQIAEREGGARENGQVRPSTKHSGYPRRWWRLASPVYLARGPGKMQYGRRLEIIWRTSGKMGGWRLDDASDVRGQ
jgi:hypothetical protein